MIYQWQEVVEIVKYTTQINDLALTVHPNGANGWYWFICNAAGDTIQESWRLLDRGINGEFRSPEDAQIDCVNYITEHHS